MEVNVKIDKQLEEEFKLELINRGIPINSAQKILFGDDRLNSVDNAEAWLAIIVSSTSIILNLCQIIKAYVKKSPIEIEYEKEGIKLKFDSSTTPEDIEKTFNELSKIMEDESTK